MPGAAMWVFAAAGVVPGLVVGALATGLSLWMMLRDAGAMFRAAFVASLVLFVKDMPEQEGEPGNLFKGPIFAAVMVTISA